MDKTVRPGNTGTISPTDSVTRGFRQVVETEDGLVLHARVWEAEQPTAAICLVHGYGEHLERYDHVATQLTEAGIHVFAFDQRGHGRSPGKRGYIVSYDQFLSDIERAVQQAQALWPQVPLFLYGHSMGGGEVLNFVLRGSAAARGLAGVIATSPWLGLTEPPGAATVWFARAVMRLRPSLQLPHRFERGRLSHVPAVDEAYFSDPYVHAKMTAPLFLGTTEAGQWTLEHAAELDRPLLLMHGTADRVTSPEASARFAAAAPAELCTWVPWEGLYHELHNEYEGPEVIERVIVWISDQISGQISAQVSDTGETQAAT